jgi:hypothetical protein
MWEIGHFQSRKGDNREYQREVQRLVVFVLFILVDSRFPCRHLWDMQTAECNRVHYTRGFSLTLYVSLEFQMDSDGE